jgi:transcriptional regulator with XRE-family HTH domain
VSRQKIGAIIQQRREFLSLKQEDVAEMGNVTPKTIYLVEHGKGNPSIETLQKILNVLGLEILIQIKQTDK